MGHEKTLLLYSTLNYEVSDIISTYVYREGLVGMQYSYTAAVDLFTSVVNLVLVLSCNWAGQKDGPRGGVVNV